MGILSNNSFSKKRENILKGFTTTLNKLNTLQEQIKARKLTISEEKIKLKKEEDSLDNLAEQNTASIDALNSILTPKKDT